MFMLVIIKICGASDSATQTLEVQDQTKNGLLDAPCKGFPILPMGKVWSAWTSWAEETCKNSCHQPFWNLHHLSSSTCRPGNSSNLRSTGVKVMTFPPRIMLSFKLLSHKWVFPKIGVLYPKMDGL